MKNKFLYITLTAFMFLGTLNSCSDFLDINTDPNVPSVGQANLLLPSAQAAIAGAVGSGSGISLQLNVFTHQFVRRGEGDQYVTNGNDFTVATPWQTLYSIALQDLRVIIDDETAAGNMTYVGIAKILKAYSFSVLVDVWGDVPFSESTLFPEVRFPVYDDDETIYPQILAMLDEAVSNLNDTEAANAIVPGTDDLFYGGNTGRWIKFANTLKLKMLYQMRDVGTVADRDAQIVALFNNPDTLIASASEDFEFAYGTSASPQNRHGLFVSEYTQANPGYYVSPWLFEMMSGLNSNILTGVTDPRIPYYWHRQLTPGEAPENPFEYLTADGFLTIHFGSIHPNQASGQQSSQTVFGLYPCGGFYDDGSGTKVSLTTGNGAAPERILPYFKVLYMQAELALDGTIVGDHRQLTVDAIQESFDKVNAMVGTNGQTGVPAIAQAAIDNYILAVMTAYDAGNDARKLEIILTQKWLASLGNSIDTYNDYRREGYPIAFDPNNYNGADPGTYQATTTAGRSFPVSIPWEKSDLDINPNAPTQKDPTTDRVFWDAN
ncbi:MAG: SusD/RagB family nutrient-binding outer membrane lipoprotein [Reichenbachiella sp.]